MRLIRGLYNCPEALFEHGCVATIGNFDGVHLGHQAIIRKLTVKAAELGLPSVVILFEPHPQEVFRQADPPARLYKLCDKLEQLQLLGVDYVLCFRFNQEFRELSAHDFVEQILKQALRVQHLFIGDDFRFGYQRQGDFEFLKSYDFAIEANESVVLERQNGAVRISSSQLRAAIAISDFALAQKMLGRHYAISGKVAHGDKQGRELGVPTANIVLKRRKSPLQGVYAVKVFGLETDANEGLAGVANVGRKPTLKDSSERLEVHLLDFDQEIYGQRIWVEPVAKIRDEKKFASIDGLKQQIAFDIQAAKQILY
ncbi:bifunctional riboflavin kinase/FAD synthetase [Kangiella sp. TOML190]|uniref:bifunctional riboflavin kinase/FAD synthetase n=1 Tax=Kangiella sp. TOML190 TaxID=2931351 RepID=UPI00203D51DC|nr:bifunctional riboflavin kinase/FAD synthetase [Kangiella sp. TOML190]